MNINTFSEYHFDLGELPVSDAMFVGLSYKKDKNGNILDAFCDSTNSGKVISKIEELCQGISIHKTNLVKGVPLKEGKIRYPNIDEKKDGIQKLLNEISVVNPKVVYLFGKQVYDFVKKTLDLEKISDYEYKLGNIIFILAHHPSYIYIYKRKEMDEYINTIVLRIQEILT